MNKAAQTATMRAFLAEISAAMLTFIMSAAAMALGGTALNIVSLFAGIISIAGVMTTVVLEANAWAATPFGKVTTSVYLYAEAISVYIAAVLALTGGFVSVFVKT